MQPVRPTVDDDYDDYDDDNWRNRETRQSPPPSRRAAPNIQPKPQDPDPYEDDFEDDVSDIWAEEPKKIRQEELEEI